MRQGRRPGRRGPRCRAHRRTRCQRRLRRIREEALNLLHGVVDLDIELHLAERGGRFPRISSDAVVLARRRVRIGRFAAAATCTRRRNRVAFGRRDQVLALPPSSPPRYSMVEVSGMPACELTGYPCAASHLSKSPCAAIAVAGPGAPARRPATFRGKSVDGTESNRAGSLNPPLQSMRNMDPEMIG